MASPWGRALELADQTPISRNRYVDFLRAASILVVVLGHWMMAAPHLVDGAPKLSHMLDLAPWTRWLTWGLQVMPTFFVVGGFSNSISWENNLERGGTYSAWLTSRLRRLIHPVVPLLLFWAALGTAAHFGSVAPEMLRTGSQVALVPTWFLSVYVIVILLVPWTIAWWNRLGMASVTLVAAAAVLADVLAFGFGFEALRWLNYAFVWVTVHQLGYAWRAGKLDGLRAPLLCLAGLGALFVLVMKGPYPISMVGVPGEAISNSLPPTVALLALGFMQAGLLLTLESPLRRWLDRRRVWAATVLVNVSIMTLFLWHSTVLVLVIGVLVKLGGPGLGLEPGTGAWWWSRLPWVATLALLLLPFMATFGRYERSSGKTRKPLATWRPLAAALLFCLGVAFLALDGIGGSGPLGIRLWAVTLPLLAGVLVSYR